MAEVDMNKMIVTCAFGKIYEKYSELTFPTMKMYASKLKADFFVLPARRYPKATGHWEKLQIRDLLKSKSRVLWLDCDTVVRPDTPDLFSIVDKDWVGGWNEAPHGPWNYKAMHLKWDVLAGAKEVSYPGHHMNTGVMLLSPQHAPLLDEPPAYTDHIHYLWDQGWINYRMAELKMRFFDITHRYNHMFIAPKDAQPRTKSFIIHYCGTPVGGGYRKDVPPGGSYIDVVQKDLKAWT
jgi:hypothetical protein